MIAGDFPIEDDEAAPLDWGEVQVPLPRFQDHSDAEEPDPIDEGPPLNEPVPAGAEPRQGNQELLYVERMMGRMRLQRHCMHPDWSPVSVGGEFQRGLGQKCDLCHMMLKKYLLRCIQCHVRACVRCRRNRLR